MKFVKLYSKVIKHNNKPTRVVRTKLSSRWVKLDKFLSHYKQIKIKFINNRQIRFYENGLFHNLNGPAIITYGNSDYYSTVNEWCYKGQTFGNDAISGNYSQKQFEQDIKHLVFR